MGEQGVVGHLVVKMGLFEFVYGTAKPQLGCCLLDGATWDQSVNQQLNSTVPLRGTRDPPFRIPIVLSSRSLLETYLIQNMKKFTFHVQQL